MYISTEYTFFILILWTVIESTPSNPSSIWGNPGSPTPPPTINFLFAISKSKKKTYGSGGTVGGGSPLDLNLNHEFLVL